MLPRLALDCIEDRDRRNAVLVGEGVVCLSTSGVRLANRNHLLGIQARAVDNLTSGDAIWTPLAPMAIAASDAFGRVFRVMRISARHDETSLRQSVLDVIAIRARKEMSRIATRRVVARVTGEKHSGVDAPAEKQRQSGRGVSLPLVLNAAIPTWNTITDPRPTGVRTARAI